MFGGLLAVGKQAFEFWQEAHKRPAIELITGGDALDIAYDSVFKTLHFSFNIGIANNGTAADAITGGVATLERLGPNPKQFISSEDLKFYDTDKTDTSLRLPFFVSTDYQKTLYCVVSTEPGGIKPDGLEASNDLSRLHLAIKGTRNSRYTADLCFYLTEAAVSQLLDTQHVSFVSPNHCGEAQ